MTSKISHHIMSNYGMGLSSMIPCAHEGSVSLQELAQNTFVSVLLWIPLARQGSALVSECPDDAKTPNLCTCTCFFMPYLQPYRRVIIPSIRNENSPFRITHHPQSRPANSPVSKNITCRKAYGTDIRTDPQTTAQNSEVAGGRAGQSLASARIET